MLAEQAKDLVDAFTKLVKPGEYLADGEKSKTRDASLNVEAPHEGTHFAEWLDMLVGDGALSECSPELFVMFGPEGAGKKFIAAYYAMLYNVNLLVVPPNLRTGGNLLFINQIYAKAKRNAPCIVFFDYAFHLFPNQKDYQRNGREFEADQICEEMRNLVPKDRVWTALSSDASLVALSVSLAKYSREHGMVGLVQGVIPDERREKFIRDQFARLTHISSDRIPRNAVKWVMRYSQHATFQSILRFIELVVSRTKAAYPKNPNVNNEHVFNEDALINFIHKLVYKHNVKDKHTGVVVKQYSVFEHPDGEDVLRRWPDHFTETIIDGRYVQYVPSDYVKKIEDDDEYKPGDGSGYGFTSDDEDDNYYAEPASSTSTSAARRAQSLDERVNSLRSSSEIINIVGRLANSAPPETTCPTSPSYIPQETAPTPAPPPPPPQQEIVPVVEAEEKEEGEIIECPTSPSPATILSMTETPSETSEKPEEAPPPRRDRKRKHKCSSKESTSNKRPTSFPF